MQFVCSFTLGLVHTRINKAFNSALCFSLYLPVIFFVFLTALMMVWLIYSDNLPTLSQRSLFCGFENDGSYCDMNCKT